MDTHRAKPVMSRRSLRIPRRKSHEVGEVRDEQGQPANPTAEKASESLGACRRLLCVCRFCR
ncbi:MAG: hypothetical protein IKI88_03975 [Anaerotignum sp.]|nr:hypothetical protein [Anaerotignum sp.]